MDLICLNSARQVGCGGGREGPSDHPAPGMGPWKLVSMGGTRNKWDLGVSQIG